MNTYELKPIAWYCVNCANLVYGFQNENGETRCVCKRCGTIMVRKLKTRREDTFNVVAPKGLERISINL